MKVCAKGSLTSKWVKINFKVDLKNAKIDERASGAHWARKGNFVQKLKIVPYICSFYCRRKCTYFKCSQKFGKKFKVYKY